MKFPDGNPTDLEGTMVNLIVPILGALWDIITDGDDTLWMCGPYYDAVSRVCVRLIQMQFPEANEHQLRQRCRRIQSSLIRKYGYYYELYEDAWVEVYLSHCHRHGQPTSDTIAGAVYRAAASVHDGSYPVYPGVIETLSQLRAQGHRIHLLTMGEDGWQREKAARNGLNQYLTSIHVAQRSKGPQMRLIANGCPHVMIVGDSLVREIQPAVRLGIPATWIHSDDPWAIHGCTVDLSAVHRIPHFTELPGILAQYEASHP